MRHQVLCFFNHRDDLKTFLVAQISRKNIAHQNVHWKWCSRHLAADIQTSFYLEASNPYQPLFLLDSAICRQNSSFYIPVFYNLYPVLLDSLRTEPYFYLHMFAKIP